ncbi:peptidase S41 family [Prevotella sp. CAG:1058]|nr:peptidase S41 family [Prevotella sp. CAG:1058]
MRIRILQLIMLLALPFTQITAQEDKDHNFNVGKNMQVFNEIYNYLDLMYVDTLNADEVVGTAINSMLRSLDPYTIYYPEDQVKNLRTMITGRYVGIGAVIRYNQKLKRVVIDEPYAGNPAAEVGLKKGDIILSIDDSTMVGKDVSYVSSHLRGDPGTTFVLKIKRPSTGKVMNFTIKRRSVELPSIPFYGLNGDGIGYLNLSSFTEGCAKDVRRALVEMKQKGMKGFVLDLRGNGGGSLSEAVDIVNMLVPKGITLVKTRGKLKRANRDYTTSVEPIDSVMPVVVLVNGESASASEITSGSLQDLDRAVILGTRTYGKGLVQLSVDLSYNGQLKLTTGKYYIPSGRCIQAINYKHARGGYTEHIPDSLTKVFHTVGGREVRDGGGIKPDIVVRPDSLPNIAYYLTVNGLDSTEVLLDYEIDYIASHPTIAPAADFEISDADYEDFKRRVIESGFTYDPESERALKSLKKIVQFEGYYDDAKTEFENLEKKLKHDIARDLDMHRDVLKQIISSDIVAAYYFQSGAIENSLKHDKQVKEAFNLIKDTDKYKSVLNGTYKPADETGDGNDDTAADAQDEDE